MRTIRPTDLSTKSTLSYAIAAVLGGVSVGSTAVAAGAEANADSLGEIIVTAQRRTETMQNVPISMQAFTATTLSELNIATFEDYIKYLPNVTSANNGPGQNEVFMRVSERRHLPRQPVRAASGAQPRHLRRRPEPHRGPGRPAGHPVRLRR